MRKSILAAACVAALLAVSCTRQSSGEETGYKTEALPDSAWDASEWISVVDAPVVTGKISSSTRSADGASWFVATVTNGKKVVSARWMSAGLGIYELYINGVRVGGEFLKPGFTHSGKTKRSFTYDISDAFRKKAGAENVLSAQVTPGWWGDKIATPGGHEGMKGRKCAFRSVLELTYSDGTSELFGTGTGLWKAGIAGPVKHAGIFDGEEYDARELPGFATPEKLSVPEVNTEFEGEILPSEGAEVYLRKDLALKPVRAYVWENAEGAVEAEDPKAVEHGKVVIKREYRPGEEMLLGSGEKLVIDFGQNAAAVPSFVFQGAEGVVLSFLPAEILNDGNGSERRGMDGPEGSIHRRNLRLPDSEIRVDYTFGASEGPVAYMPRCTFFGYRYASVTATGDVRIKSVESVPVTSIAQSLETGTLTTGNELVNKLVSNTVWGQRSNYLSVPTDCPQRDERLGWMADTQVFTETGTFFANTDRFFHKWLRDVRDSQSPLGSYPGVAPTAQYGGDMMRLGWADAGIIVPWTVWKQFGDVSVIEESWESMERFMAHIAETEYDHAALSAENGNYQWADWLSYEPLESCSGRAFTSDGRGHRTPRPEAVEYWNYLSASYWLMDSRMMRDMASATGRESDADKYAAMAEKARVKLCSRFFNDDGSFREPVLNTMQTPALFALHNALLEGSAKEAVCERLRRNFAEHDGCLQTGFLGTAILLQTLTDNGMAELAYDVLLQRRNPSWIYSIDNGATTIWERWNSYMKDEGMGPNGMNSFNHYAYGSVCQWLWESAAGIAADTSSPGFRHIVMKPVPDKRLGSLDAVYKSAAGEIRSSWKYEGDTWKWTFTVPEGATASVTLPGEDEVKEYKAGTYSVTK